MGDISRGIATAALTLQTVMLQALVSKGVLTTQEALEVVYKSLDAVMDTPDDDDIDVAEVADTCVEQVREACSRVWLRNDRNGAVAFRQLLRCP